MSEQSAILQAILAEPDDDLHRLAYADCLEETGVRHLITRAEFIRLQLQLDQVVNPTTSEISLHRHTLPWEHPLRQRERHLLEVHGSRWFNHMLGDNEHFHVFNNIVALESLHTSMCLQLDRGFVSSVRCDVGHWWCHGPRLTAEQPVMCVRLTNVLRMMDGGLTTVFRGTTAEPGILPVHLFHCLRQPRCIQLGHMSMGAHCHFNSQRDAEMTLSRAALEWAKNTPLTWLSRRHKSKTTS